VRVLVLSSVYPNASQPAFGTFVRQRVRAAARHCAVEVVAPVPWFPFNRIIRGSERSDVPHEEVDGGLRVHHPRVLSLPAVGKSLDAFFYFLSILVFVRRLRRRFAFDVIDAHFTYPDGVAAVLLGKALGCPVMLTVRGNEVVWQEFRLHRWQMQFALRRAHVVAVSNPMCDLALRLGARKVRVIANGIDAKLFFHRDQDAAREALDLPRGRPIVVSVGGFVADKGHELVVELLPKLRQTQPSVLYVAVGNPGGGESRLHQVRESVQRHGLEDCVRLIVARPHEEIGMWLAAADVFCLATRREGCPNAILEALACGLPVVTTDIPANREIIREGENGFLVPYFDGAAFRAALERALERDWDRAAISATMTRTWEDVGAQAAVELRAAVDGYHGAE
jgi:glycosyltransferase involved in cell wall biosynthesis